MWFERDKGPSWWGGAAAGSRQQADLGGKNRKLRDHIFYHKQEAECEVGHSFGLSEPP